MRRSPDDSSGHEEDGGGEQEGEALHEVQRGRVEGVEDAAAHQEAQALHTGDAGEQDPWEEKEPKHTGV